MQGPPICGRSNRVPLSCIRLTFVLDGVAETVHEPMASACSIDGWAVWITQGMHISPWRNALEDLVCKPDEAFPLVQCLYSHSRPTNLLSFLTTEHFTFAQTICKGAL